MADLYPIFLSLTGRPVLLVGAGHVALRKATGLLAADAKLTVIAPPPADPDFATLPPHIYEPGAYDSAMMLRTPRWSLVFAATDRPQVNAQVLADARAQGILCTRCDQPDTGDFSNPALLQRPGVTVAVSTHGASPVLAVRLRDGIAADLDPLLLQLSEYLAKWRPQILAAVPDPVARRALLTRLASPDMEEILRHGGTTAAEATFALWLQTAQSAAASNQRTDSTNPPAHGQQRRKGAS